MRSLVCIWLCVGRVECHCSTLHTTGHIGSFKNPARVRPELRPPLFMSEDDVKHRDGPFCFSPTYKVLACLCFKLGLGSISILYRIVIRVYKRICFPISADIKTVF